MSPLFEWWEAKDTLQNVCKWGRATPWFCSYGAIGCFRNFMGYWDGAPMEPLNDEIVSYINR